MIQCDHGLRQGDQPGQGEGQDRAGQVCGAGLAGLQRDRGAADAGDRGAARNAWAGDRHAHRKPGRIEHVGDGVGAGAGVAGRRQSDTRQNRGDRRAGDDAGAGDAHADRQAGGRSQAENVHAGGRGRACEAGRGRACRMRMSPNRLPRRWRRSQPSLCSK